MASPLKKIKRFLELKKAFKRASFVLRNGNYCLRENRFYLVQKNNKIHCLKILVRSKEKNPYLLDEGIFKITPYKILFMDDKMVFTFVNGKDRFHAIKENINHYSSKLPYKTMSASYITNRHLIISNVVKGVQYSDDEHLLMLIDHYLREIKITFLDKKQLDMSGISKDVLFYPQHGDCHSKNIFWNSQIPTLIDLDDVDLYPLFYDVFYYIIASKHEGAFSFFRTKEFEKWLKDFCDKKHITVPDDIIDFYLASYVYYWINKMKPKMSYHEIDFYLKWFVKADLSSYPITSKALEQYKTNLKDLRILK